MAKTKQDATNHDREMMKRLIGLFEQVYAERLVYKAIAERDTGCSALVDALKADRGIREGIARTFTPIYECIDQNQSFMKLLEALPSMGSKPSNGTTAAVAANH